MIDLRKLSIELPHDPAVPFLGIYLRELKTYSQGSLYTDVHSKIVHNFEKWKLQKSRY